MSEKHPIIAITGSSGSGSHTVSGVFEHIAWREKINHIVVHGSAFHRYERLEMSEKVEQAKEEGDHLTHFSPKGNRLDLLQNLLESYADTGTGRYRHYLHSIDEAKEHDQEVGTFTPWEELPADLDLLVYQGLHGAYADDEIDISAHADLVIGVSPIVNLEWIQKIHTDMGNRGYSLERVKEIIQNRLYDYVHYITPQFSKTDINFQRIPLVDTSNPFCANEMPENDESMVVIRFNKHDQQDFPDLLRRISGSFVTRRDTLVVPGGKMEYALELILNPLVHEMMERRKNLIESVA